MPKFRYVGAGSCRHGTQKVERGDVVEASSRPGKNFVYLGEESEGRGRGVEGGGLWAASKAAEVEQKRLPRLPHAVAAGKAITSNFTILSAGLFNPADFSTINYYATIGPVVVQCWSTQDDTFISDIPITVVKSQQPLVSEAMAPHIQRLAWQAAGILLGLEQCDTQYTIRVRNDEHVSDLSDLIDAFLKDTKRLVCSNMFWPKAYPMHIGDHIFVAETELLRVAYRDLKELSMAGKVTETHPSPEWALFKAWVCASRKKYLQSKPVEAIADRVGVVSIEQFGNYCIRNHTNDGLRTFTSEHPCDLYELVASDAELGGTIDLSDQSAPWR